MFTVSRTVLPHSAFEPVPRHTALDNAVRIKMNESRQSAMSISSDLFPELLSWAAFIDMTQRPYSASPPLPQGMPNDIAEDDIFYQDIFTESHPPLLLSRIFDPTTLAIGFDLSHFDGLDEQLIYSPQDAFLDLCWPHNECPYSPELEETAETISAPSLPSGSNLSSIDSESECQTQFEDTGPFQQFDASPTIKVSSFEAEKSPFIKEQVRDYLFNFDYPFNQDGSVGAFPVPVAKQTKPPRGFTAFASQWSFGRP